MPETFRRSGFNDYGEIEPVVVAYLNALTKGNGVKLSAAFAGMTKQTVRVWRNEFPDFAHEEQMIRDRLYVRFDSARYCKCPA